MAAADPGLSDLRGDGSGYPAGLAAESIPLAARIFAVVDNSDALSPVRPYRKAWARDEVVGYISDNSGKMFDPRVGSEFIRLAEEE